MNLTFDWPEWIAMIFLILGFAMALFSASPTILYTVCFLMGLVFGRIWYKREKKGKVPLFYSIMTFFIGFIVGALFANIRFIVFFLLAGILAGYWIHRKRIIHAH